MTIIKLLCTVCLTCFSLLASANTPQSVITEVIDKTMPLVKSKSLTTAEKAKDFVYAEIFPHMNMVHMTQLAMGKTGNLLLRNKKPS